MTTIKTDTVITISLKEYARLQAMKKDVQKAKEALKPHYTFVNNGTGINHAYNLLCRALEGDK